MAEKRTDAFTESIDELSDRLETQIKFIRRQQAALPNLKNSVRAASCLARLEGCPFVSLPFGSLRTQLKRELVEQMATFWQELESEATARGLDCRHLLKIASSWATEQEHKFNVPTVLKIGVFQLEINFAQGSVCYCIGGVPVAKPGNLCPSSIIDNLCKSEVELKERQTIPRLALTRLLTAASVLSSEREDFTLAELWPIVHSIGLVASNFGRRPSKANLGCYTKAQFMYDTAKAFEYMLDNGSESAPVVLEGGLERFSLDSKVKISRNGALNGK